MDRELTSEEFKLVVDSIKPIIYLCKKYFGLDWFYLYEKDGVVRLVRRLPDSSEHGFVYILEKDFCGFVGSEEVLSKSMSENYDVYEEVLNRVGFAIRSSLKNLTSLSFSIKGIMFFNSYLGEHTGGRIRKSPKEEGSYEILLK